jgi:glycerophosphoryl diester phosphodiesterase
MSFSSAAMRRVRTHAPRLPTVLLLNWLWPHVIDGSLPAWADITGPGVHLVRADPGYVQRSRARGHDTYCWTVDEPADVTLCRDLGVRYLATNSPADTRRLLSG